MEPEVARESVVEIVRSVWDSVLAMALFPSDTVLPIEEGITSCVQISGTWNGVVCARFSLPLARRSAGAMLDLGPSDLSQDDLRDALGELANMIGGNLKSLLPAPSTLTIPWVTTGDGYLVDFPHCELLTQVTMCGDDGTLTVTVLVARPHERGPVSRASGSPRSR